MSAPARAAAALLLPVLAVCGGEAGDEGSPPPAASAAPAASAPALEPPVERGALTVSAVAVPRPPAGERAALYLVVANRGTADDALVGVATPAAGAAGLHRTVSEGGVSAMRAVDAVPVPAGGEARLAPGGFHGMLEGLVAPLTAGDVVPVVLRFREAGEVEVRARVVPYADLDALYPAADAGAGHASHAGGEG